MTFRPWKFYDAGDPWTRQEVLALVAIVHMSRSFRGEKTWIELTQELSQRLQNLSNKSDNNPKITNRIYSWAPVRAKMFSLIEKSIIPAPSWVLKKVREGYNAQKVIAAYAKDHGYDVGLAEGKLAETRWIQETGRGYQPSPRKRPSPLSKSPPPKLLEQSGMSRIQTRDGAGGANTGMGMDVLMTDVNRLSINAASRHPGAKQIREQRHRAISKPNKPGDLSKSAQLAPTASRTQLSGMPL